MDHAASLVLLRVGKPFRLLKAQVCLAAFLQNLCLEVTRDLRPEPSDLNSAFASVQQLFCSILWSEGIDILTSWVQNRSLLNQLSPFNVVVYAA